MMRYVIAATLALMTALAAPVALAQDEAAPANDTPSDQAWVDDCPPDMMCAAGSDGSGTDGEPQQYGDEDCIECSGPSDGGAEPGEALGPEDCIDCMQPPRDGSSNCMDGQQEGETCDDDVQYFGGEPARGPDDGSCENCRGDDAESGPISSHAPAGDGATSVQDDAKESAVPAPGVALGVLAVGLVALLAGMRRVR